TGEAEAWCWRRRGVRHCGGAAKFVGKCVVDCTAGRETVERRILVEARHLDRPLDRLACTAKGKASIRLARYREHAPVDRRRVRPVDREFCLAGGLALIERREIEKRKAHRALDLEGPLARQENRRRMRVDASDLRAAMG